MDCNGFHKYLSIFTKYVIILLEGNNYADSIC